MAILKGNSTKGNKDIATSDVIGTLGSLTTSNKSNIVNAVNEVKSGVNSATNIANTNLSKINTNISNISSNLSKINTANSNISSNLSKINTVTSTANTNKSNIGTLSNLDTGDKSNLVEAINEVKSAAGGGGYDISGFGMKYLLRSDATIQTLTSNKVGLVTLDANKHYYLINGYVNNTYTSLVLNDKYTLDSFSNGKLFVLNKFMSNTIFSNETIMFESPDRVANLFIKEPITKINLTRAEGNSTANLIFLTLNKSSGAINTNIKF